MSNSLFDLGIPKDLPTRDVIWDYCKVEIENKALQEIFEELLSTYLNTRNNLQPTYGQFSSYRLYLRYQYFKKKILELPFWSKTEIDHWNKIEIFNWSGIKRILAAPLLDFVTLYYYIIGFAPVSQKS
jgi:hypothetical protein